MGAPHVHVHRSLLLAAAEKARLREDGDAREPLLLDAEPVLHRHVAVPGPQHLVVGCRCGEVPGVDIGCDVGRAQRCALGWSAHGLPVLAAQSRRAFASWGAVGRGGRRHKRE